MMTSFRFHLRPCRAEGQHPAFLFIRIIHKRKYKDIRRAYTLYPHEWDSGSHTVCLAQAAPQRRAYLREVQQQMQKELRLLEDITNALDKKQEYSLHEIIRQFHHARGIHTLEGFCRRLCSELTQGGRLRTARAYRSAVRSLTIFCKGKEIALSEISDSLIRAYEYYLLEKGLQMNTISFYMRNLRAIYYKAIAARLISAQQINPFSEVFTGVYQTRRRALDIRGIHALAELEGKLSAEINQLRSISTQSSSETAPSYLHVQKLRESLLYFLFAYHSRGMSFIDLAYLKKSELSHQTIRYKRRKTGGYLEVRITRPMKKIIRSFKNQTRGSRYVFPILSGASEDQSRAYETALNHQNKRLKQLACLAGIKNTLSTHVARHTWATQAKRMGYGITMISEGLGHRDVKVTSIYLASFERSAMDELSHKLSALVQTA